MSELPSDSKALPSVYDAKLASVRYLVQWVPDDQEYWGFALRGTKEVGYLRSRKLYGMVDKLQAHVKATGQDGLFPLK